MALRGRDSYEDLGAEPIMARNQHGSTPRSNILAQTDVHRIRLDRQLGSEPYIAGRVSHPLGASALARRTARARRYRPVRCSFPVGCRPLPPRLPPALGRRCIRGGRARPSYLLCLAALCRIRQEFGCKATHTRLSDRGKTHTVALVAVMPKLISLLNAQLRHHRLWQPEPPARPRVTGTGCSQARLPRPRHPTCMSGARHPPPCIAI